MYFDQSFKTEKSKYYPLQEGAEGGLKELRLVSLILFPGKMMEKPISRHINKRKIIMDSPS